MDGLLTWIWPRCRWISDLRTGFRLFPVRRVVGRVDVGAEPRDASGLARLGRSCRVRQSVTSGPASEVNDGDLDFQV